MTSSPVWTKMSLSDDAQRLKQLLPSTNFLSRTHSNSGDVNGDYLPSRHNEESSLQYPLLQPIKSSNQTESTTELIPWSVSSGAIVIQIRFSDMLNKLPLFDQILGEVIIPISRLAEEKEIEGWFKVKGKDINKPLGSNVHPLIESMDNHSPKAGENGQQVKDSQTDLTYPQIYVKVKLDPAPSNYTDIDKETSIVVAEQLARSANFNEEKGVGFIGTSISTFNTVRGVSGNVQYLQNQLGSALDTIEMVQNTFNFAVSFISRR